MYGEKIQSRGKGGLRRSPKHPRGFLVVRQPSGEEVRARFVPGLPEFSYRDPQDRDEGFVIPEQVLEHRFFGSAVRERGDRRNGRRRGKVEPAETFRDFVERIPEGIVLSFQHGMRGVEIRRADVPMVAVRLEVQRERHIERFRQNRLYGFRVYGGDFHIRKVINKNNSHLEYPKIAELQINMRIILVNWEFSHMMRAYSPRTRT
jgi:hypothetical protein